MKKAFFGIMVILLLTGMLMLTFDLKQAKSSETPATEWSRTYGGPNDSSARSVVQTNDGGYAIAGRTKSFGAGDYDFWLVKTDWTSNMEWNKTYGGTSKDDAYCVVETSDGGYILTGHTYSYGKGLDDMWLVKTDGTGNMQWNETYGGTNHDEGMSVVETGDGGYAIAGLTESYGAGWGDFWLVKTDAAGKEQWSKTYGGASDDYAYSVVETGDGGYAIAGSTKSYGAGGYDFWLVKTDGTGNMQWNETYGGTNHDYGWTVVQTGDGGYALAGRTESYGVGNGDFWLVKTDADGNMMWNKTYGGASEEDALSMVQTMDGGYALAGPTSSFGAGDVDFWLVKIDVAGNVQWNKTYGGIGYDYAFSVVQTNDGGYVIGGWTESYGAGNTDFWLIKLAPVEIPATIDIDPDTLNLRSNGEWITTYIELSEGYSVRDIDIVTISLNDTISVDSAAPTQIGDYDGDFIPDLMVKFDRATVVAWLDAPDYDEDTGKSYEVTFTITGKVAGTQFEGVDTVRVLSKR